VVYIIYVVICYVACIGDPAWYTSLPFRKKKVNLTLKRILLQWTYNQYCMMP